MTAAERLHRQLVADELRGLLRDAGVLGDLRALAELSGETLTVDNAVSMLRSAVGLALNYETMARAGTLEVVPEWVRQQAAAE